MIMRRHLVLVFLLVLSACGSAPTVPAVNVAATQTRAAELATHARIEQLATIAAVASDAAATRTAEAALPTATPTPNPRVEQLATITAIQSQAAATQTVEAALRPPTPAPAPTATPTPKPAPPTPTPTPIASNPVGGVPGPGGYSCQFGYPIKGNLTTSSGDMIYHVPGGQYYDRTIAEECFATEADAQAAGYRRSLR